MTQDLDVILQRAYSAQSDQDLLDLYSEWAGTYDRDVVEKLGYRGHLICIQGLLRHFDDRGALILDVGCGSGLVGQTLAEEGFKHLDGLDISEKMLEEASDKGVYKNLFQADLNETLSIATDTYDSVVCAGTFTYGHVRGDAFSELARITRKGGIVCFTIRDGAYQEYDYSKDMAHLENERVWTQEELTTEKMFDSGVTSRVGVYRIL